MAAPETTLRHGGLMGPLAPADPDLCDLCGERLAVSYTEDGHVCLPCLAWNPDTDPPP